MGNRVRKLRKPQWVGKRISARIAPYRRVPLAMRMVWLKRQRKRQAGFFLVVSLSVVWALPGTAWSLDALPGRAVGVVEAGEANYGPYEFVDKAGRPAGFNIDVMRAIAKHENLRVHFELGNWSKLYDEFMHGKGKIDIMAMFVSPERARFVRFAKSCLLVSHKIYALRDEIPIKNIHALSGKWVLVDAGTYAQRYLGKHVPKAHLVPASSEGKELKLLALGEYDYAVISGARGDYLLHNNLGYATLAPASHPLMPVSYCFAVRRGNEQLLAKINDGLQWLYKTGEYSRIHAKWLPYRVKAPVSFSDIVRLFALMLVNVSSLALLYGIWFWVVRKRD